MKAKELYEQTGEGPAPAGAPATPGPEKKEPKKRKTKAAAAEPEDIPVEDVSNKKKKVRAFSSPRPTLRALAY